MASFRQVAKRLVLGPPVRSDRMGQTLLPKRIAAGLRQRSAALSHLPGQSVLCPSGLGVETGRRPMVSGLSGSFAMLATVGGGQLCNCVTVSLVPDTRAEAGSCASVRVRAGRLQRHAARRAAYAAGDKYPSGTQLQKRLITDAKKTPEREWLSETPAQMLQQAVRDCDTAYKNFFDSLKGKRAGRKLGRPRFKSRKDNRQSIRFRRGAFSAVTGGKLMLAKIGAIVGDGDQDRRRPVLRELRR